MTQAVKHEMAGAANRKRTEEQTLFIPWMVDTVYSLTKYYSPDKYQNTSTMNLSITRSTIDPKGLPDYVPSEIFFWGGGNKI